MGDRTRRRVGRPPADTFEEKYARAFGDIAGIEPWAVDNLLPTDQAIISSAISLKRIADMMEKHK